MNKHAVVGQICAQLAEEAQRYTQAARAAQAGATDDQSRAENKYDTRGLEASYLSHGQSRQAEAAELARQQFAALDLLEIDGAEGIRPGTLVEVEEAGERLWYYFGPSAGGLEVIQEGGTVQVVTMQSPLGRVLSGRRPGERLPNGWRVLAVL